MYVIYQVAALTVKSSSCRRIDDNATLNSRDSICDAQIRFPVLADVELRGTCARQYDVQCTARGVSARANFILDRQGIVRLTKVYPDLLNPGVEDLLTTSESLAQGDKRQ
jgi:alkyl hydroperoxide reductase subunit AhpC